MNEILHRCTAINKRGQLKWQLLLNMQKPTKATLCASSVIAKVLSHCSAKEIPLFCLPLLCFFITWFLFSKFLFGIFPFLNYFWLALSPVHICRTSFLPLFCLLWTSGAMLKLCSAVENLVPSSFKVQLISLPIGSRTISRFLKFFN